MVRTACCSSPAMSASLTGELESVLGDAALRHRLSAAAIRTIEERYTREQSARRFGELYGRFCTRFGSAKAVALRVC